MGSIAAPQPRSRHLATTSLLLPDPDRYLHDFRLRDAQGCSLVEHGGISLLELKKFHAELVRTEQERWLKFFKEGASLDSDTLPPWMQTPEMRQAMSTLKTFTEQDRAAKEAALAELERPKAQMRTQEGESSGKSEKGRAENGPKVARLGYGCS